MSKAEMTMASSRKKALRMLSFDDAGATAQAVAKISGTV